MFLHCILLRSFKFLTATRPNLYSGLHKETVSVSSLSGSPCRGGEAYSINEWKPRIHSAPLTHEPDRAVALGPALALT
jgi:hypothetical protein